MPVIRRCRIPVLKSTLSVVSCLSLFCLVLPSRLFAVWNPPSHTWGGGSADYAASIAVDSGNNIYLGGRTASFGAGGNDALVVKYDANGSVVWARTWGGASDDYATGIGIGPDGYIYVAGGTSSYGAGWYDAFLLKFDTAGNLIWNRTWGAGSYEVGYDVAFDSAGNIYVAAESYSAGNAAVFLKFDPAGDLLSNRAWKGPATYDSAYSVDVDTQGNVLLAGISWDYSVSPEHNTILLLKYDPNGNLLWSKNWVGPGEDETWGPKVIRADAAGNVYVLGRTTSFGVGQWNILLFKLDPNGIVQWSTTWGGSGFNGNSQSIAGVGGITLAANGNLEIISSSNSFLGGQYGAVVLQYTPSGTLASSQIFGGSGDILGQAVAFDHAGNLFTAGAGSSASGQWQSIEGSTTVPSGVVASPSFTVSSPGESVGNPAVVLGSPSGILDVGAGGQDVFVAQVPGGVAPIISGQPVQLNPTGQSTTGPAQSSTSYQQQLAEPISTGNGNYYYEHTDLAIPGRGPALVFRRSYNSLDNYVGPLGANWNHSFNITLAQTSAGVASIRWGDGHGETFTLTGSVYVPQPGVYSTFIANSDGTYTLVQKNRTTYHFSSTGRLTAVQDKNGNTILLSYDGSGNLTQITDSVGRNVTISYDGNARITQVVDPIGRVAYYAYDNNNNLVSMTDAAGGLTQYTYDGNHRVTTIAVPNGNTLLQNAYDSQGRVISQTNGRSFAWQFAYNTPSTGVTTITDARGANTLHAYDSSLRITQITDPLGHTTSYTYDAQNNRTSVSNPKAQTTAFGYDSRGNLTTITNPLGSTVQLAYDAQDDLIALTNPKGKTTAFAFDNRGNLVAATDALGNSSAIAYDFYGEPISKTNANGKTTTLSYNSTGDLIKVVNPLGQATTLAYDGAGRLVSVTDANGHTAAATYDALDRLTQSVDPLGDATQFAYDAVSNLLKRTDANNHTTRYTYDAANNLVGVVDANGNMTQYSYDGNNNRTGFTNANGRVTSYGYDAANRLISSTDPLSFVITYSYDPVGNVVAVTDAKKQTNQLTYDMLNRIIGISYADGKSVAYAYDADGNRSSMGDPHGSTNYGYDALDRLTSIKNPNRQSVNYAYDAMGNRTGLTYPDGKTVRYAYDAVNRLAQVTDWLARSTNYSYDAAGNLSATKYPNGAGMAFAYDSANRMKSVINSQTLLPPLKIGYTLDRVGNRTAISINGILTSFTYDALNELVGTQFGLLKTTWTYDRVGNRLQQMAPLGKMNYTYDAADRLLAAGTQTFAYDANGNRVSATDSLSKKRQTYAYDAANRLIAATGLKNSSFSYDGDGNRIAQTVGMGTYNYLNDVASILPVVLQESGPDGNISYAYGLNLIEASSSSFNYFYQYDGLGSVIGLTNSKGIPEGAYAYDAWGNALLTITDSVGTKNKLRYTGEALDPGTALYFLRARYYDPTVGRFLSADTFGMLTIPLTLQRYSYGLNQPTQLTDPSGRFVWFLPGIAGAAVNDAFYGYDVLTDKASFSWSTLAGRTVGGFVAPYAFTACLAGGAVAGGACAGAAEYIADHGTQLAAGTLDRAVTGQQGPSFSTEPVSWTGLVQNTVVGALLGPVSKALSDVPNVGRNPTSLWSFLTGRETQKALFTGTIDEFVNQLVNFATSPNTAGACSQ
jgi:RHS repeat-associated protein